MLKLSSPMADRRLALVGCHQSNYIARRKFLATLLGGAVAWPLAARAQQPGERMRRVGVLTGFAADDPAAQKRVLAFAQALAQLGWIDGRNVRIGNRSTGWHQGGTSHPAGSRGAPLTFCPREGAHECGERRTSYPPASAEWANFRTGKFGGCKLPRHRGGGPSTHIFVPGNGGKQRRERSNGLRWQ
jgi:hypothetical protein